MTGLLFQCQYGNSHNSEKWQITNTDATLLLFLIHCVLLLVSRYTTQVIKLKVWPHVSEVRKSIGQSKESSDGSDIPGVLAVEAVFLQTLEMILCDGVAPTHSHCKVQHGELSRGQLCILVVYNDLVKGNKVLTQDRTLVIIYLSRKVVAFC